MIAICDRTTRYLLASTNCMNTVANVRSCALARARTTSHSSAVSNRRGHFGSRLDRVIYLFFDLSLCYGKLHSFFPPTSLGCALPPLRGGARRSIPSGSRVGYPSCHSALAHFAPAVRRDIPRRTWLKWLEGVSPTALLASSGARWDVVSRL